MTDLEMTKLCAEAMGYRVDNKALYKDRASSVFLESGQTFGPLRDDAQAMALVKKCGLQITGKATRRVGPKLWESPYAINADINRAIVECVAKMQMAKA